jgi:hypothetical protein
MSTNKALKNVHRFVGIWNKEHFYQNVLDIQAILCLDDNEEKLRRLRRRKKSLCLFKSDIVSETLIENLDKETISVFKTIEFVVQAKLDIIDKVIQELSDDLVSRMMMVWLDEVLSRR